MNRKYELEDSIKALFVGGKLSVALAEQFSKMDYEALSQAIAYEEEPVFRYRVDNYFEDSGEYRSERLLPIDGTRLYSQIEERASTLLTVERRKEIWILQDLTLAVLSVVEITNLNNNFSTIYQTLRTDDIEEIPYEIDIDCDALASSLLNMCKAVACVPMPFQEL